jgi:glycosyltransferase involved in cell wall biosynthesis
MNKESKMPLISVVIPAFNEEEAIGKDLDSAREAMEKNGYDYEIIVVDDGSVDKTAAMARAKGVTLLQHKYNRGYGAAIMTGIKQARGEIIVTTDADNTYPNRDIPRLIKELEGYDMVVGWRQMDRKLAEYITRARIPDLNSGFRAFRRQEARRYFHILPQGHSWVSTITVAFLSDNLEVKYIPIEYYKRIGRSKFHPITDTYAYLMLIFRTVMYFRPLKIFFPLASIILLWGFTRSLHDAIIRHKIKESDIMIFLTGLIIFVLGLIADLVVKMSHRD